MDNILVVGGTGMLSKATQWLNARGSRLTIIARNEEKLGKVSECCEYPENNTIISLDYQDSDKLQNSIQEEQKNMEITI
ncbi:hypothetical protein [Paenibacillus sp. OSY-SE]|uniref:hypothetical protein n=1 Tax=Paenibacillus sp. OSY-SE TaxID=1196323 RepID=UPI00068793FA|nr:hypothetical protein [Paenibacillus sp. OSY-SE]